MMAFGQIQPERVPEGSEGPRVASDSLGASL